MYEPQTDQDSDEQLAIFVYVVCSLLACNQPWLPELVVVRQTVSLCQGFGSLAVVELAN